MSTKKYKEMLFYKYFEEWIELYKVGAVRDVTLRKYEISLKWLKILAPDLKIKELNRKTYQQLLNDYAVEHEKETVLTFHHQIKSAIFDAYDEGYLASNPTRKIVIKGKNPKAKKKKYLSQFELQILLKNLDLNDTLSIDWLILLIAKTGLRFSEALAITPNDFDFSKQTLSINKSWNYKEGGKFSPTKNKTSNRIIQLDWKLSIQFSNLLKNEKEDEPIFKKINLYNSLANKTLEEYCSKCNIPIISIHGLRHTHASILLYAGVSVASVAKRLGHSNISTTQKTYLHIIQELEIKDTEKIIQQLGILV